jgi:hypothetical protein
MVLPIAYALMAAGGYRRHKRDQADEARQAEIDAEAKDEREFRREERQRTRSMRRDVADAAAPVAVEPNLTHGPEMDDRDVGTPGAVLQQDGFRVGNARMADRGAADAMAASANTGDAKTARMAAAYEKHGEVDRATSIRSSARQGKVADMQLDEMQQAKLTREYDRRLLNVPESHDAVAQFIAESMGDGQGGKLKATAVANPDGKTVTYHTVNPDGTTKATPYTFEAGPQGVLQAKYMLSRGVEPKEKLAHIMGEAKTAEDRRRWEKEFGLREKGEERRAAHDKATLANDSARVGIARMAASAKADGKAEKMDEAAKLQYKALIDEERRVTDDFSKGVAAGTVQLDDGKGGPTPQAQLLQKAIATAKQRRMGFEMQQGLHDPKDIASNIASGETDAAKIGTGIAQVYQIGGREFGDKVFQHIRDSGVLEGLSAQREKPTGVTKDGPPQARMRSAEAPQPETGPLAQVGAELDAARQARTAAEQKYRSFGLRQQAVDPKASAQAEAAYSIAVQVERAARQKYEQMAQQQGLGAAHRYAQP